MHQAYYLPIWHYPLCGFAIFVVGCCLGSFFNVCVYRLPLGISIVTPRSRCASCGIALKAWQNIPLLGWGRKGGWCACGLTRIDFRYFLVELGTGLLCVALWMAYSPAYFGIYSVFLFGLLIASLIDIDLGIIPDRFSLGGIAYGLIISYLFPDLHEASSGLAGLENGLLGAAVGAGLLLLISWGGRLAFKKEAMGLGDVKLLAAMGALLGWPATLYIVAISSLIGSLVGISLMFRGSVAFGQRLPFGPFLSLAATTWIFGGSHLAKIYLEYVTNAGTANL